MHDVRTQADIDRILGPGAARWKLSKRRRRPASADLPASPGHFDPETHAALLRASNKWDSVLMPVHAADHAYRSFEKIALSVAVEKGIGNPGASKSSAKRFFFCSLAAPANAWRTR